MSISFAGSSVLSAPSQPQAVPGFGALGLSPNGTPQPSPAATTPSPTPASSSSNPYQQAYDSLAAWSSNYLLQAIESGAPQIPQYTAGGTASSFAQLTTLLGEIAPAVQQGLYGNGTGVNALA